MNTDDVSMSRIDNINLILAEKFNDVGHYGVSICGGDVISIFPSTRTCPELYPETSLFVESHLPSNVTLSNMSSHQICLSPRSVSV